VALIDDYVRQLKGLLPRGPAWNMSPTSNLHKLLEGIAAEFVRVHERALDLLREADPRAALELFSDWEVAFGLPDVCASDTDTRDERRKQLMHKIVNGGGQSKAFFIEIAAVFGYSVTITDYRRFRAGLSRSGDRCYGADWMTYWEVHATDFAITRFRAGAGRAGDALAVWGNDVLECVINRAKPAHTSVNFRYGST
jgi:uncharacterized protein YmfQ (DUF2313 family)